MDRAQAGVEPSTSFVDVPPNSMSVLAVLDAAHRRSRQIHPLNQDGRTRLCHPGRPETGLETEHSRAPIYWTRMAIIIPPAGADVL